MKKRMFALLLVIFCVPMMAVAGEPFDGIFTSAHKTHVQKEVAVLAFTIATNDRDQFTQAIDIFYLDFLDEFARVNTPITSKSVREAIEGMPYESALRLLGYLDFLGELLEYNASEEAPGSWVVNSRYRGWLNKKMDSISALIVRR